MKKLQFIAEYRRLATQMRGHAITGNWMRLAEALEHAGITLTAQEAADWAALGMLPEEAGPLILDGVTAATYRELEDHAEEQVGGRDALAERRILELLGQPGWYGPGDVVRVQDPTDPEREIVIPRDEL